MKNNRLFSVIIVLISIVSSTIKSSDDYIESVTFYEKILIFGENTSMIKSLPVLDENGNSVYKIEKPSKP